MPDISVSETQLEELEAIRDDLESAYVGEYGTVRMNDTLQYLLDTYTPPDATEGTREPADIEGLRSIDGVGESTAESLAIAGFRSVDDIAAADPEALTEIKGIGDEQAVDIVAVAAETDASTTNDIPDEDDAESGDDDTDPDRSDSASEADADASESSPESTLQQAMDLLDAHDTRWRESSGDEPYEVDLPDGSTETVRTKDDIKRLIFKHWQ
ncbi:MAG: helix-hairpin-helix domain-containing protein [Natronomonas sp.]